MGPLEPHWGWVEELGMLFLEKSRLREDMGQLSSPTCVLVIQETGAGLSRAHPEGHVKQMEVSKESRCGCETWSRRRDLREACSSAGQVSLGQGFPLHPSKLHTEERFLG